MNGSIMTTPMLATGLVEGMISSVQFLVFIALAIGGLMFLGMAALFGGHHAEVGHDIGHGADHGADHDAAPSFLSPRVFFAFLTGFGVAGAIATLYGATAAIATGIGFIPGMVMATIAWGTAFLLFKQQANSSVRSGQVIGSLGTVVTGIPIGGIGEVNLSVNGQIINYTAMANDEASPIPAGVRIKVIRDLGDKVVVAKDGPLTGS